MKKALCVLLGVLAVFTLFGCKSEEPGVMENKSKETVLFVNGTAPADVWILPDTQANRKTTVWGKAAASGVPTRESRAVPLPAPGENGLYLLRMIDAEGFYYSADAIALSPGCTLRISEAAPMEFTLAVQGANGETQNTYSVFCARL